MAITYLTIAVLVATVILGGGYIVFPAAFLAGILLILLLEGQS